MLQCNYIINTCTYLLLAYYLIADDEKLMNRVKVILYIKGTNTE